MEDPGQVLRELMEWRNVSSLRPSEALQRLGSLLDASHMVNSDEGTNHALALLLQLDESCLSETQRVMLNYFKGSAYSSMLWQARLDSSKMWEWENPNVGLGIFHLRKALRLAEVQDSSPPLRTHILTDLANAMSFVGRIVEAVELWKQALADDPAFAMALGNLGQGLMAYAGCLYDSGHAQLFREQARVCLVDSLSGDIHLDFRPKFVGLLDAVDGHLSRSISTSALDTAFSLGESTEEARYRQWCLDNGLFLNPLNDLGAFSVAARDILTTPPMFVKAGTKPVCQHLYNHLKQSFVSSRYMAYLGTCPAPPHYSDRDVAIYRLADSDAYGWHTEMLLTAFRCAYSIFDKVAVFLWHYFGVQGDPAGVTFRGLWFHGRKSTTHELKAPFADRRNWPLRGLYWLGKDFLAKGEHRDCIEPDARNLAETRNFIEHRFMALRLDGSDSSDDEESPTDCHGGMLRRVGRRGFEASTLRILKLARAALIYLSMAIYCEDREKHKTINESDVRFVGTDLVRDDRKV